MNRRTYMGSVLALFGGLALLLTSSTAVAGPTWRFGAKKDMLLRLNYAGQYQLQFRDTGSGDQGTDPTAEFNFRRNRLQLIGAAGDWFGFYFQTEFMEDVNITPFGVGDGDTPSFQVLDVMLRFKVADAFQARVGKFKYNLTRENLEGCFSPLNTDRSLYVRAPLVDEGTRDKGIALWGNVAGGLFQYRVDAMNGRNDSASAPASLPRLSARVHLSFLDPENTYGYKGTYLGKKMVLTVGGGVQYEPKVAYADVAGKKDAKDYFAWTADLFGEFPVKDVGTFTVSAAYASYNLDNAYKGIDPDPHAIGPNGEKKGGYAKVGYLLPHTPLQFFLRGELWRFANFGGFADQGVTWYGGGLNYYFNDQKLRLSAEAYQTDFDKEGTAHGVETHDFVTVLTQLQWLY